ncbi:MAG: Mu-like prophage major head subunit gpT family protein [Bacteroidetes bacterium]|nr:Mu-like prophage major head subunit gpT family protein [Bacteroidota bacterium]
MIKKSLKVVIGLALLVGTIAIVNSWTAASGISMALLIGPSTSDSLYRGFKVIFNDAFNKAQPSYNRIAMTIPSNTKQETYAWLGAFPRMKEWIGPRNVKNLAASDWTIKNKKFEVTIEIPSEDIEDDTYNLFNPMIGGMGMSARMHPDELVFSLLNAGFTQKCYDGKNFFDTTHAFGSNKSTKILNATYYGAALAAIGRIKDSTGNPLFNGSEKLTLVTGPELEETAKQMLNADFISVGGGSTQNNVWKGTADYLKSPQVTSPTAWFIIVDFMGLRPLIFQERKAPRFITKNNPQDSDYVFMNDKYVYGVDSRDNAGYGLPQLAYGSDGTVA